MIVAAEQRVTPEDLLKARDGERFDLVNGRLVERKMGAESDLLGSILIALLYQPIRKARAGRVFGAKTGYQIFPDDPNRVRFPDASFVKRGRLPKGRPPLGHIRIRPDLVIEAVSPNDTSEEVEARVCDYQSAKVPLIWVLHPRAGTIHVYRQNGQHSLLRDQDVLSGEDIVPGFEIKVADLFQELEESD